VRIHSLFLFFSPPYFWYIQKYETEKARLSRAVLIWKRFDNNKAAMSNSCSRFGVPNNSPDEIGMIWNAIQGMSDCNVAAALNL
jgi:hypothetical protein